MNNSLFKTEKAEILAMELPEGVKVDIKWRINRESTRHLFINGEDKGYLFGKWQLLGWSDEITEPKILPLGLNLVSLRSFLISEGIIKRVYLIYKPIE